MNIRELKKLIARGERDQAELAAIMAKQKVQKANRWSARINKAEVTSPSSNDPIKRKFALIRISKEDQKEQKANRREERARLRASDPDYKKRKEAGKARLEARRLNRAIEREFRKVLKREAIKAKQQKEAERDPHRYYDDEYEGGGKFYETEDICANPAKLRGPDTYVATRLAGMDLADQVNFYKEDPRFFKTFFDVSREDCTNILTGELDYKLCMRDVPEHCKNSKTSGIPRYRGKISTGNWQTLRKRLFNVEVFTGPADETREEARKRAKLRIVETDRFCLEHCKGNLPECALHQQFQQKAAELAAQRKKAMYAEIKAKKDAVIANNLMFDIFIESVTPKRKDFPVTIKPQYLKQVPAWQRPATAFSRPRCQI